MGEHQPEERTDSSRRRFLKLGLAAGAGAAAIGGGALGYLTTRGRDTGDAARPDVGSPPDDAVPPEFAEAGDGTRQSPWFREAVDGTLECTLCPHRCRIEPGQRGICRVRMNRDGVGHTLVYGTPALVQIDPVERKPYFHVTPGRRALSISTAGCPLKCSFCEVWDMALVDPEEVQTYDLPPQRIVEHARANEVHAISYAFGEPVAYYEYVHDTAKLAKEAGMMNLVHTSGYIAEEPLAALVDKLDAVNLDVKSIDPEFYRRRCGGELRVVQDTARRLKRSGVHIEVTNLVIPTLNDDESSIRGLAQWIIDELGPDTPLHLARFYPLYQLRNLPPTPVSTLENARAVARDAGVRFVYIARVDGHEAEDTYCPSCGEVVIDRLGFVVEEMRLEDGRCPRCGTSIPGRWV